MYSHPNIYCKDVAYGEYLLKHSYKKILFFDGILLYLILIFVWIGNTSVFSKTIFTSAIQNDTGNEKTIDPYHELKKKVAITFDDGPNADYTEVLLDGLKERGVKATFFLLGKEIEKYPEIVERIYKEGHLIGTHAYDHVDLCKLSDEKAIEQINKTNQVIYEITGNYPEYIRPPFGSWKCNLDYETEMIEVLWDVDPLDWKTADANIVAKRVIEKVEEDEIILLHDASETSVQAAFQIIDILEKEDYEFVTVEEIIVE